MKAILVTRHLSASVAKSLARALQSDNEAAPKPLHIRSRVRGRQLISVVTGAPDIQSLLTTMDDLILCMIVGDRLLSKIEARRVSRRTIFRIYQQNAPKV